MIIKKINVDLVNVAKYNPRKDLQPGDPEYERLKRSVECWDLVEPLVWNKRSGNLVGGHQRLKILTARGDSDVDVSVVDLDSQAEAALNIALNKIGGEWDMPKLADLLSELDGHGFDATFTGFDGDELENLLTWTPGEIVEDEVPPVPDAPESKLGEVYELGRHRVMCGDSTAQEAVSALLGGAVPFVFSDPPYGISIVAATGKVGGDGETKFGKVRGENWVEAKTYAEVRNDDSTETAKRFYETCRALGFTDYVLWGGNYFTDFVPPSPCWIVWDKENTGNFADVEMAWTSLPFAARLYRWMWNGLARKGDRASELVSRVHPTQKPVGLFCNVMRDIDFEVCLDGFLGSGTTLIAAEQLGRTCYGMEIEPKYVDVIRQRYANFVKDPQFSPTGKLTNGKTYARSST